MLALPFYSRRLCDVSSEVLFRSRKEVVPCLDSACWCAISHEVALTTLMIGLREDRMCPYQLAQEPVGWPPAQPVAWKATPCLRDHRRYPLRYPQHSPALRSKHHLLRTTATSTHHLRHCTTHSALHLATKSTMPDSTSVNFDRHDTPLQARSQLAACPQGRDKRHARTPCFSEMPSGYAMI